MLSEARRRRAVWLTAADGVVPSSSTRGCTLAAVHSESMSEPQKKNTKLNSEHVWKYVGQFCPPAFADLELRRTLRYVQRPPVDIYIYRKIMPVVRLGWLAPARQ